MELLIEEFLINFSFIVTLFYQFKLSIESSKGITTILIESYPILICGIVSNDFLSLNQLDKFSKYINLGDPIAISGSIDSVPGSVDLILVQCQF